LVSISLSPASVELPPSQKQQNFTVQLENKSTQACLTDKSREGEFSTPGTLCHHLICI
jgi:hypothetical protein